MAEAKLCAVDGCGKKQFSRGVCNWHYNRLPGRPKCSQDACSRPVHGRGLCSMHHHRLSRHGDPLARDRVNNGEYRDWIDRHKNWQGEGCLPWPYSRDKHGYGPSRKMCEAAHGPAPSDGHQAAHSCGLGHEGCVSPHHLRWATRSENQLEMVEHGNGRLGEVNYMTPLTEADVKTIRSLDGAVSRIALAQRYGVSRETIRRVQKGITWGWLE